ncbi:pirin family protein [Brevibacillus humidisoli]|uniref:pirin family protein n=1 Tax=Brevibacillus humidisoli TaxID=2895522 RepID=UPI001E4551D5|nr:pirin family protein [Brevibacillus humidisoli]UFJ39319.1 pirin family protein [Brevibacillus humidisoli]
MIQIIPSDQRFLTDHGWLKSRFSFSFAEYYDPNNLQFGPLRVFNDDVIQPGTGFGMHPHRDMEIMTYVIEGVLEHKDSIGNTGIIRPGEVQRMTAGNGIYHSEYNPSEDTPLHLLQIWFLPNQKGLTPSWEQKEFTKEQQTNCLFPVVSGRPNGEALSIHQDLTVYLSRLEAGRELTHQQEEGRKIYLFVISGDLQLDGEHQLSTGDSARIDERSQLHLATTAGAEFMLMDLA